MNSKAVFTLHALDRVADRLHMSVAEVEEILNQEKTVLLGYEPGTRKMHLLFYSTTDQEYFVAVQDEKTREVVTILPFTYDYYRTSFHHPSRLGIIKARARRKVVPPKPVNEKKNPANFQNIKPSNFYFALYFRNRLTEKLRVKTIVVSVKDYPGGKTQMEGDDALHKMLVQSAEADKHQYEYFENVFVRLGRKGTHELFDLQRE